VHQQGVAVGLGGGGKLRADLAGGAALVSITNGCLRSGSITAASGRATTSAAPPGGNGLTMVTGRSDKLAWRTRVRR
jgi:hypothetical protein